MDVETLDKFKIKVQKESEYTKLYSRDVINRLIEYFDVDVKPQKYEKTISNSKEIALSYYQKHFPKYYEIITNGIKTNAIKISNGNEKSEMQENGECFIKPNNDDYDLLMYIHEFGHYINSNITPKFVDRYRIFGEVPAFYFEKHFEENNIEEYMNLIYCRRKHRITSENRMLRAIKYMLEYEDYYKEHGNIDKIIDEEKIKLILKLSSYHGIGYGEYDTVNTLLKYPIANLISSYMIINGIEMSPNIENHFCDIDLCNLMDDSCLRESIMSFDSDTYYEIRRK